MQNMGSILYRPKLTYIIQFQIANCYNLINIPRSVFYPSKHTYHNQNSEVVTDIKKVNVLFLCISACVCDEGFIRSGGKCVPKDKCGCISEGEYFAVSLLWC